MVARLALPVIANMNASLTTVICFLARRGLYIQAKEVRTSVCHREQALLTNDGESLLGQGQGPAEGANVSKDSTHLRLMSGPSSSISGFGVELAWALISHVLAVHGS